MKFFVYPYTQNSMSATKLSEELGGKKVLRSASSYKHFPDHVLINWGCGECPHPQALNYKIMDLIDKKKFFSRLKGTGLTPEFATNLEDAKKLPYPIFCRTVVDGKDGKGIVIADCQGQLVTAPLYVSGVPKTGEYRIHVGRLPGVGVTVIGGAKKGQKAITPEMTNVPSDTRIWCGDTTYFGDFTTTGLPSAVTATALAAMEKFPELSFAAFDVVCYLDQDGVTKAYVIEGNSAPMYTPATCKAYAKFFRKYADIREAEHAQVTASQAIQAPVSQPVAAAPIAGTSASDVLKVWEEVVKGEIKLKDLIQCYVQNSQKS